MAPAVFVTKSNTKGEALWFLRAGCSVVSVYHLTFSVSNIIPRKLWKWEMQWYPKTKHWSKIHGVHRNSCLWRSAQIIFSRKNQVLVDNFSLLGFHWGLQRTKKIWWVIKISTDLPLWGFKHKIPASWKGPLASFRPHANSIAGFRRVRTSTDFNFTMFLLACRHWNIQFLLLRVSLKEAVCFFHGRALVW